MRTPIPWNFTGDNNDRLKNWNWETDHFRLEILAETQPNQRSLYSWKIIDKTTGQPVTFDTSVAASFNGAVDEALEIIGKAYPASLGYQKYAGELATTFQIADGRRIDLAPFIGMEVIVRVIEGEEPNLHTRSLIGTFGLQNYSAVIRTGENGEAVFPPVRLADITRKYENTSLLKIIPTGIEKNKRIAKGVWRKGCTGKPGFAASTVVHTPQDGFCPIHHI